MGEVETPDRDSTLLGDEVKPRSGSLLCHSSVCVSISVSPDENDITASSSFPVSVSPPLPAQRNRLPVQTATLAQAETMKEIDKYCENLQVCNFSIKHFFRIKIYIPSDTSVRLIPPHVKIECLATFKRTSEIYSVFVRHSTSTPVMKPLGMLSI